MLHFISLPPVSIVFELDVALFSLFTLVLLVAVVIIKKNHLIRDKTKRMKILKEIIDNIHKNFNIKDVKEASVQSIGAVLEADRCLIAEYNPSTKKFGKVTTEYLSSEEILSLKGDLPAIQSTRITNICINNKILNISDAKKYLLENELQDTLIDSFYQKYSIKSVLAIPIRHTGKVLGAIVLHYTKKNKIFSEEDIHFITGIAESIGTAIYQSNLYEELRIQSEMERTCRKIVDIIRSSVELNSILESVIRELLKYFEDVQRVFIGQIDLTSREHFAEATSNLGLKKFTNIDNTIYCLVAVYWQDYILKYKTNKVIDNIEESDMPADIKKIYMEMGVKSIIALPVKSKEEIWGAIFLSSIDNYKKWSEAEIAFLESIVIQLDIAIRQAELINSILMANKRNNDILNSIPFMVWLKDLQGKFVAVNGMFAKMVRTTVENIIGKTDFDLFSEEFSTKYSKDDIEVIQSKQKTHIEELIEGPKGISWHETFKNPVFDTKGNVIGTVGMAIDISERKEGEFKIKQAAEREVILRKIIEVIRSSIDVDFVKHEMVFQIGNFLKADRVAFADYDFSRENYFVSPGNEYRSSPKVKTFLGYDFSSRLGFIEAIRERHLAGKDIIFTDLDKYLEENDLQGSGVEIFYKDMGFMSSMAINLYHGDLFYGDLVITFEEKCLITEEDINFVKTLANQAGIAISQADLYKKERQAAEREKTLRELISMIRQSLELNEIKHFFVETIGKYMKADRVILSIFDQDLGTYLPADANSEYLSHPNQISFVGYDWSQEEIKPFIDILLQKQEVIFNDLDQFIEENKFGKYKLKDLFINTQIGSSCNIPIVYKNLLKGYFCVDFNAANIIFQEEDLYFLRTLSDQAGIALHQAQLLEKERKSAERERIIKDSITLIRSTLDIKEIKKNFITAISKYLDSDLNVFFEFDTKTQKFIDIDKYSFYLSSPDVKSPEGLNIEDYGLGDIFREKALEVLYSRIEDFKKDYNLYGTPGEDFINNFGIKSAIVIPFKYKEQLYGVLGINYTKDYKNIIEEDIDFVRTLANQAGIAMYQSSLYQMQSKIAYKERVLKEIISEIKLTRDLNHAYKTLLHKLADIFNLNRTLFLETSQINPEELDIKYEYVIDRKDMSVNNLVFPQVCVDDFLGLIHELQPLIIEDVARCHPEETSNFFHKYKIEALMSVPLVKYNGVAQVLGFIVLCSEETRNWTDEEIDLIKAIADNVVSVIWEISKFLETEELRNSFVLTLAHDFQVPLVGERTALEYLLNYSECSCGQNKEILQEILENNQNISILLDKSVDIYNYEAGKKTLELESVKLAKILNETIFVNKSEADFKKVKINLEKSEEDYWVKVDKKEIMKVFSVVLKNAIQHSPDGDEVKIEYYKKSNRTIISMHNGGKPIPAEIQEKIFKRYEMAHAIERKIGAGTGLFLCKRIVEAHKGAIWFDSSKKFGTTFYVSLPFIEGKESSS